VDFFGICTNLHSVWDYEMIELYEINNNIGWDDLARDLIKFIDTHPELKQLFLATTDVRDWANESFFLTKNIPYNFSPGTIPPNGLAWLSLVQNDWFPHEKRASSCKYFKN